MDSEACRTLDSKAQYLQAGPQVVLELERKEVAARGRQGPDEPQRRCDQRRLPGAQASPAAAAASAAAAAGSRLRRGKR
jgi:hypothetical protein